MTSSQLDINEERARRLAANEATFREVNERVAEVEATFGVGGDVLSVLCECALVECTGRIEVAKVAYEAVRAHAARFIVLPPHVLPEVEDVVDRDAGYVVAEKREGSGADEARRRDPRTR